MGVFFLILRGLELLQRVSKPVGLQVIIVMRNPVSDTAPSFNKRVVTTSAGRIEAESVR